MRHYLSMSKLQPVKGRDDLGWRPDVPETVSWAGTTTDQDDRYIIVVNSEADRDACLAHNAETVERSRAYLEALADARGMPRAWIDGFSVS